MHRIIFLFIFLFSSFASTAQDYKINLPDQQVTELGQLIWKNEGQQKLIHLTTWNKGEDFPSLGIGHFIWYPTQTKGAFKEQFPALLSYFKEQRIILPTWLDQTSLAPWKSREQFYSEFNEPQLTNLRLFLSNHINAQVRFIIQRLENAIPTILSSSTVSEQQRIKSNLEKLTSTPEGVFVLLDYINFKGEGISDKEAYQGEGWGLKQVLLAMPKQYKKPRRAFAFAADEVLTRRVKNAPRDESRWLKGWRIRIHAYQSITVN